MSINVITFISVCLRADSIPLRTSPTGLEVGLRLYRVFVVVSSVNTINRFVIYIYHNIYTLHFHKPAVQLQQKSAGSSVREKR